MSVHRFVTLTPEQRRVADARRYRYVDVLRAMARDDSDPETRDHARLLLANRGIRIGTDEA